MSGACALLRHDSACILEGETVARMGSGCHRRSSGQLSCHAPASWQEMQSWAGQLAGALSGNPAVEAVRWNAPSGDALARTLEGQTGDIGNAAGCEVPETPSSSRRPHRYGGLSCIIVGTSVGIASWLCAQPALLSLCGFLVRFAKAPLTRSAPLGGPSTLGSRRSDPGLCQNLAELGSAFG